MITTKAQDEAEAAMAKRRRHEKDNPWPRVWKTNPTDYILLTWQELNGIVKLYDSGWVVAGPGKGQTNVRPMIEGFSNWEFAT